VTRSRYKLITLVGSLVVLLAVGTFGFALISGCLLDALFLTVITLSTVRYGR
jgi:hypothetical protein